MGFQIGVHTGDQVLGVVFHRLKIGLHGVGERLPQQQKGGLPGRGVQQIVALLGYRGDAAAFGSGQQSKHNAAIEVAHHIRRGAFTSADLAVELCQKVHGLLAALVPDAVAELGENRLVEGVHLRPAGGGEISVLAPVEEQLGGESALRSLIKKAKENE